MNKLEAYLLGKAKAKEIANDGEFTPEELANEDAFIWACHEIESNHRQYAGNITEELKTEAQWDRFDEGFRIQIEREARKRIKA